MTQVVMREQTFESAALNTMEALIAARNGGKLTAKQLASFPQGRAVLAQRLVKTLVASVYCRDASDKLLKCGPFTANNVDATAVDKFYVGLEMRPNNESPVTMDGSFITRLSVISMLVRRSNAATTIMSNFTALSKLGQGVQVQSVPNRMISRRFNNLLSKHLPVTDHLNVSETHTVGVVDFTLGISLSDAISFHLSLNNKKRSRMTYVLFPYTAELFTIAYNVHAKSINSTTVIIPFYTVQVDRDEMNFTSSSSTESFNIGTAEYIELMTRCYVPTDSEVDVQIEVHSEYYGWRVMKINDLEKSHRKTAETYIRSMRPSDSDERKLRVLHAMDINERGLVPRSYMVDEKFYLEIRRFAASLDKLNVKDILQYATARNAVIVSVGPMVSANKSLYSAEILLAVTRCVFAETYISNDLHTTILKNNLGSVRDIWTEENTQAMYYNVAMLGAIAMTTALPSLVPSGVIVAKYLVSTAISFAAFTRVTSQFWTEVAKLFGVFISNDMIPSSESLSLPETFESMMCSVYAKPLCEARTNVGIPFKLQPKIVDENLVCDAGGNVYRKSTVGDVFDCHLNRYVKTDDGAAEKKATLFSRMPIAGITNLIGDLYCSENYDENPMAEFSVPTGYIGMGRGHLREIFSNGSLYWIRGYHQDMQRYFSLQYADEKKAHPVTILNAEVIDREIPVNELYSWAVSESGLTRKYETRSCIVKSMSGVITVDKTIGYLLPHMISTSDGEEIIKRMAGLTTYRMNGWTLAEDQWFYEHTNRRLGAWLSRTTNDLIVDVFTNHLVTDELSSQSLIDHDQLIPIVQAAGFVLPIAINKHGDITVEELSTEDSDLLNLTCQRYIERKWLTVRPSSVVNLTQTVIK